MRIALCQIDTTVGDLQGNRDRALDAVREAASQGAVLALLPELTLTGYPPRDLLDRPAFVAENLRVLDELAAEVPQQIAVLCGFVERSDGPQPSLFNAVALLQGGAVRQVFRKRLLPTYDVFDEDRYFEPGTGTDVFELSGTCFGVTICEDVWNAVESPLRRLYDSDPVADVVAGGADVLLNIAASPFTLVKRTGRPDMLAAIARKHGRPLVFVNLV
ncbi:MAG: nitrilase-related carbon-nitrogen hydrolase, partial [Polyangiales bacterium]